MTTVKSFVAVGIRGPIAEGEYAVGDATVTVAYPAAVDLGLGRLVQLPKYLSTLFVVSWPDSNGKDATRLRSDGFERHLVIYDALDRVNEVLLAFKLSRISHVDGGCLRTVGVRDTLFYFHDVDGQPVGGLNVGLRDMEEWEIQHGDDPHDPFGTTSLALPHLGTGTFPVARRYVRCFELDEHGFYTEAFLVAFSILDDTVQQMLHRLLMDRGMESRKQSEELLRGIKENRLRVFVGPLLKVLCGNSLADLWPRAGQAIDWLNNGRNRIAHGGGAADHTMAARGIYACIKALAVLHHRGLVDAEITLDMYRYAALGAAWTEDAPAWVPAPEHVSELTFDS